MGDEFNVNDQARANYEGWCISHSDVHGYQIQKFDENETRFKNDGEAALFLTDMAFEFRSDYHRSAIEYLIDHGGRPDND